MGESLLKRMDDPRTIHGTGRPAPNQEPAPARADVRPLTRVIEVRTCCDAQCVPANCVPHSAAICPLPRVAGRRLVPAASKCKTSLKRRCPSALSLLVTATVAWSKSERASDALWHPQATAAAALQRSGQKPPSVPTSPRAGCRVRAGCPGTEPTAARSRAHTR